jgi:hypothetical protein
MLRQRTWLCLFTPPSTRERLRIRKVINQGETINQRALLNLFKEVIKNNRAGGWRKLRKQQ